MANITSRISIQAMELARYCRSSIFLWNSVEFYKKNFWHAFADRLSNMAATAKA